MKQLLLTLPLALAACGACPPEYRLCDPVTERCVCAGPTGSTTATAHDDERTRPEPPAVEPEPDEEPDSATDPDGYERWKEKQESDQ